MIHFVIWITNPSFKKTVNKRTHDLFLIQALSSLPLEVEFTEIKFELFILTKKRQSIQIFEIT